MSYLLYYFIITIAMQKKPWYCLYYNERLMAFHKVLMCGNNSNYFY